MNKVDTENTTALGTKTNEYKLERYKFILQQLNALNDGTHKYISLFQTLSTAVIGVGITLFATWRELKIDPAIARLGLKAVLGLFTILTVFVLLSIVVNAISWYDYRNEEVQLLEQEVGKDFRRAPDWKNLWRWNETYFVLFLLITTLIIWIFTIYWLLPSIVQ
jgi:hypothetical protein